MSTDSKKNIFRLVK